MRTNYINRLIGRVTSSSQPNNDSFVFYGKLIELQSGTPDYVSVTIYHTDDRYCGEVADFSFDFLTKELYIEFAENEAVIEAIIKAFRGIYRNINVITEDNESKAYDH